MRKNSRDPGCDCGNALADIPFSLKLRCGSSRRFKRYLIFRFPVHFDVGVVVRKMKEAAGAENGGATIRIKREEPHARNAVVVHVSTNVQFVHRVETRNGWDKRRKRAYVPHRKRRDRDPRRVAVGVDLE